MPDTWSAALHSLTQIHEAINLASSYTDDWLGKFITQDPACLKLKKVARTLSTFTRVNTILITGPSGHGKEILARAMHWRPDAPFVPVNCAAIPETLLTSILFGHAKGSFTGASEDRPGVFEAAGPGTVFLDEIGDMPESQQPALLRVLQEREVMRLGTSIPLKISCRIIAATNAPHQLRHDLFGRLMAVHLPIPPLSDRPLDVELIANSLGLLSTDYDPFDPLLSLYGVRQLQSIATRKLIGL